MIETLGGNIGEIKAYVGGEYVPIKKVLGIHSGAQETLWEKSSGGTPSLDIGDVFINPTNKNACTPCIIDNRLFVNLHNSAYYEYDPINNEFLSTQIARNMGKNFGVKIGEVNGVSYILHYEKGYYTVNHATGEVKKFGHTLPDYRTPSRGVYLPEKKGFLFSAGKLSLNAYNPGYIMFADLQDDGTLGQYRTIMHRTVPGWIHPFASVKTQKGKYVFFSMGGNDGNYCYAVNAETLSIAKAGSVFPNFTPGGFIPYTSFITTYRLTNSNKTFNLYVYDENTQSSLHQEVELGSFSHSIWHPLYCNGYLYLMGAPGLAVIRVDL